jgi:hypothetical protein
MAEEQKFKFEVNWSGNTLLVELEPSSTICDLKRHLEVETSVPLKRQKVFGFKGKPSDDTQLSTLKLKPKTKLKMMGGNHVLPPC